MLLRREFKLDLLEQDFKAKLEKEEKEERKKIGKILSNIKELKLSSDQSNFNPSDLTLLRARINRSREASEIRLCALRLQEQTLTSEVSHLDTQLGGYLREGEDPPPTGSSRRWSPCIRQQPCLDQLSGGPPRNSSEVYSHSPPDGWSWEDQAVFLREVQRQKRKKNRKADEHEMMKEELDFDCGRVWSETSPAVASEEEVRRYRRWWMADQERREVQKETIQKWRQQKLLQKRTIDLEEEETKSVIPRPSPEVKAKIKAWREMKEVEKNLEEANTVIQRVGEAIRKKKKSESKKITMKKKAVPVNMEEEVVIPPQKRLLNMYQKEAIEFARKRQEQIEAKAVFQNIVKRVPKVEAERDPERLYQETKCFKAKGIQDESFNAGKKSLMIDQVGRLGVPQWRKSLAVFQ